MFKIEYYEDKNGYSELREQLNQLAQSAPTNKLARILLANIRNMTELLKEHGTYLPFGMTKHIHDKIWELRPGSNRILYFYWDNETYVLLHMFVKKTNKTPTKEIQRAIREMNDYINQQGGKYHG